MKATLATALDKAAEIAPDLPTEIFGAIRARFDDGLPDFLVAALPVVTGALVAAFLVEKFVARSLRRSHEMVHLAQNLRHHTRFSVAFLRLSLRLVSIGVFLSVALAFVHAATESPSVERASCQGILYLVSLIRLISSLSEFLFSPGAGSVRVFDLNDDAATRFDRVTLWYGTLVAVLFVSGRFVGSLELPEGYSEVFLAAAGSLAFAVAIVLVWLYQSPVAHFIEDCFEAPDSVGLRAAHVAAHSWQLFASLYLAISGIAWAANTVLQNTAEAMAVLLALLIIIVFPVVDRLVHAVTSWIVSRHIKPGDPEVEAHAARFTHIFHAGVRVILLVAAVSLLAEAWGVPVSEALFTDFGRRLIGSVAEIAIILALAVTGWGLFKYFLYRWFPDDERAAAGPSEGEGGGAGATRAQTLVPLIRSFVLIVLVIMVTMVTLDAAGVNIGPLLAGAGVVGIAVGFGAQKLVQDVISGLFFLIDDAFRSGEYIETNSLRGTVEKISLRSMQLRHHRGPLQTVPFSEIQYVRNHSRDWVIMKLEFRVPYATDIERLRKTIKKLGLELLEDQTFGSSFIEPLKSQGVLRMEHTALVVRMKFTAIPGEQWVLRKEIFRRVQERLHAEGFEFARPVVAVHIEDASAPENVQSAVAGAAAQGLSLASPEQNPRPDER